MIFYIFYVPSIEAVVEGEAVSARRRCSRLFEGVISDMAHSTWSVAMVTWFERMTKCAHAGEGGEGL